MSQDLSLDDYILKDKSTGEEIAPNVKPAKDILARAMGELIHPTPAIHVPEFSSFDRMIGGFRPNEFTILCGATGVGKSTLLANLSLSFIKQKVPHYVAPVETGPDDYIRRVVSAQMDEDWNTGDAVDESKIQKYSNNQMDVVRYGDMFCSMYENRFKVEQLMSDIAFMVKHNDTKVAMVDNLNFFLEVKRTNDLIVEMDRVIHELIIFVKRVNVHIIMVMHPRKPEHAGGRVESEHDVKGSSTAVQEAQNVILYNRCKEGEGDRMDRELKIAKMRRRGKYVGERVLFKTKNGVKLYECDPGSAIKPKTPTNRANFYSSSGVRTKPDQDYL